MASFMTFGDLQKRGAMLASNRKKAKTAPKPGKKSKLTTDEDTDDYVPSDPSESGTDASDGAAEYLKELEWSDGELAKSKESEVSPRHKRRKVDHEVVRIRKETAARQEAIEEYEIENEDDERLGGVPVFHGDIPDNAVEWIDEKGETHMAEIAGYAIAPGDEDKARDEIEASAEFKESVQRRTYRFASVCTKARACHVSVKEDPGGIDMSEDGIDHKSRGTFLPCTQGRYVVDFIGDANSGSPRAKLRRATVKERAKEPKEPCPCEQCSTQRRNSIEVKELWKAQELSPHCIRSRKAYNFSGKYGEGHRLGGGSEESERGNEEGSKPSG